jgi:hypothetical protein
MSQQINIEGGMNQINQLIISSLSQNKHDRQQGKCSLRYLGAKPRLLCLPLIPAQNAYLKCVATLALEQMNLDEATTQIMLSFI